MGFFSSAMDAIQTKVIFIAHDSIEKNSASDEYTAKINPSSITHTKSIAYQTDTPPGSLQSVGGFQSVDPEKLTLELILDGTGAAGMLNLTDDVVTEIIALEKVVYDYSGEVHETRFVEIIWGNINFFGRLTNLDYTHTMFKPSGKPLRTKVKMSFVSAMSIAMQAKKAKRSSPDLSHLITVKAGDTLPTMCQKIYNASHYYLQVAKINKLTDFRNLAPGTQLLFPPIKK